MNVVHYVRFPWMGTVSQEYTIPKASLSSLIWSRDQMVSFLIPNKKAQKHFVYQVKSLLILIVTLYTSSRPIILSSYRGACTDAKGGVL